MGGSALNGAGTCDGQPTSGSATNGAHRADGRQSIIGWGGQLALAIALFFGEQMVLASNVSSGGSLISGPTTGNLRPFVEYQVPLITASANRSNIIFANTGTNDLTTSVMTTAELQALVDLYMGGFNTIAQQKPGCIAVHMTLPPNTTNANKKANTVAYNALLRAAVIADRTPNITHRLVDLYSAVTDADTGNWKPNLSSDNVHANGAGIVPVMIAQLQRDIPDMLDDRRSVLNMGEVNDVLDIGGPNTVTAGTLPGGISAGSGAAAGNTFIPPNGFTLDDIGTAGIELRSVTANAACWYKRDCADLAAQVGGVEFILTGVFEVLQNSPASSTLQQAVRLSWQDGPGTDYGRVSLYSGAECTFAKTRLSVLFSPPEASGQLGATIAKATLQMGCLSNGGSSTSTIFNARYGDVGLIGPVF